MIVRILLVLDIIVGAILALSMEAFHSQIVAVLTNTAALLGSACR